MEVIGKTGGTKLYFTIFSKDVKMPPSAEQAAENEAFLTVLT
jgi:hypothetical protein